MSVWDDAVARLAAELAEVAADPEVVAAVAEAMDVPKMDERRAGKKASWPPCSI